MNAPGSSPRQFLAWPRAGDVLLAAARAHMPRPVVIGITGPVGSGKTTLARRLSNCVISTDSYLPDYDGIAYEQRDRPEVADLVRLAADLSALKRGMSAEVPCWSFQTHRREGSRRVEPGPLIVCEGIHALHHTVAPVLDITVYVDAPAPVRWSRWESLERSGERGWGVEAAREYFVRVAEPAFARNAPAYRELARFVVLNPGGDETHSPG